MHYTDFPLAKNDVIVDTLRTNGLFATEPEVLNNNNKSCSKYVENSGVHFYIYKIDFQTLLYLKKTI